MSNAARMTVPKAALAAVAGFAALVAASPVWAGADDGGTKLFYSGPGPGSYQLPPSAPATQTAVGAQSQVSGSGPYTATVNGPSYEQYRTVAPAHQHQMYRKFRHRSGAE